MSTQQHMTDEQVRWARQHDWFVGATGSNMVFARGDRETHPDTGEEVQGWKSFTSYRAMCEWAGY